MGLHPPHFIELILHLFSSLVVGRQKASKKQMLNVTYTMPWETWNIKIQHQCVVFLVSSKLFRQQQQNTSCL